MNTADVSQKIAQELLAMEAVRLSPEAPFTWASGWKSPIYCDNRLTLSSHEVRTFIKEALADKIRTQFPDTEAIAGVATAGIPQGVLVADLLSLPFLYVRPKPKDHGMGNQIEGRLGKNQKVVVIEDLISTGGSSLKAVEALRAASAEVVGMLAIFSYDFTIARENFQAANLPLVCLSTYPTLLEVAQTNGSLTPIQATALAAWREAPDTWGR